MNISVAHQPVQVGASLRDTDTSPVINQISAATVVRRAGVPRSTRRASPRGVVQKHITIETHGDHITYPLLLSDSLTGSCGRNTIMENALCEYWDMSGCMVEIDAIMGGDK
ncbi:hypothetical protein J6590_015905 [Homalodisca vitripennis]|nr:hypothetical protein J6590_015905 [Homalodisca vitripennis]